MPKVKWGFDTNEEPGDAGGTFDDYDGPVPPTGVYDVVLKRLALKENKNGDDMINGLLVIAEPKDSDKARFNGYGIWFNSNLTPQGLPYFKPFVTNGLGLTWADFANRTITDTDERPAKIMKIGSVKIDGETIPMRVQATYKGPGEYGDKLENPRFLARKDKDEASNWSADASADAGGASDVDEDDEDAF